MRLYIEIILFLEKSPSNPTKPPKQSSNTMDFMLANDWLHVINSANQKKEPEKTIQEEKEVCNY